MENVFSEVFGAEAGAIATLHDVCNLVSILKSKMVGLIHTSVHPIDVTKDYILERFATISRLNVELNEIDWKSLVKYSEAAKFRPEFSGDDPSQNPMMNN